MISHTSYPYDADSFSTEYCQGKKLPQPIYQEYVTESNPVQFVCSAQISQSPQTPFGMGTGPFSTKKDAKVAAAKEAVCWLRANNHMRQPPPKRIKVERDSPPVTLPDRTSLTQAVQDVDLNLHQKDSQPLTSRLHDLVAVLRLRCPRFVATPCKTPSGAAAVPGMAVYQAALHFDEYDSKRIPRLAGPIGRVDGIYGQKKAKEACYEQAVQLLEQIQSEL
jgi:hypothetical protein